MGIVRILGLASEAPVVEVLKRGDQVRLYSPFAGRVSAGTITREALPPNIIPGRKLCLIKFGAGQQALADSLVFRIQTLPFRQRYEIATQIRWEVREAIAAELGVEPIGLKERFLTGAFTQAIPPVVEVLSPFDVIALKLAGPGLDSSPAFYFRRTRTIYYRAEVSKYAYSVRVHETLHHLVRGFEGNFDFFRRRTRKFLGRDVVPVAEALVQHYAERITARHFGVPPLPLSADDVPGRLGQRLVSQLAEELGDDRLRSTLIGGGPKSFFDLIDAAGDRIWLQPQ